MQSSLSLQDKAQITDPHIQLLSWCHMMPYDVNQWYKTESFIITSQSHPGQSSSLCLQIRSKNPETGSAIIQCQLLNATWGNATSSHWKWPVNGQCQFEWSLLSLSHDGLGPAIADLHWCVRIRSECAQSAWVLNNMTGLGINQQWDVHEYLFLER